MRPSTLRDLASLHGVEIPPLEFKTFSDFIVLYEIATGAPREQDPAARLCREEPLDGRQVMAYLGVEPGRGGRSGRGHEESKRPARI